MKILESKKGEIKKLVEEGKTYKEISKIYNVNTETVARLVRENKYSHFNQYYFDKIDTEAKAYILGFIFADGSIYRNNSKNGYCLEIGLNIKDLHILEFIKQEICPVHKIYLKKNACILNISSKYLCEKLISYNILPNKSHIVELIPFLDKVPVNLHRHFIRGYFDGDGHVGISKMKYFSKKKNKEISKLRINRFGFTSSHINFLKYLEEIFVKMDYKSRIYSRDKYTNNLFFNLNKKNIYTIYEYFYKDSNYFLIRKKKSFEIGLNNTEVSN